MGCSAGTRNQFEVWLAVRPFVQVEATDTVKHNRRAPSLTTVLRHLALQDVPALHNGLRLGVLGHVDLQREVDVDDLEQLDGEVVLVAPAPDVHGDAGSDGHGGDEDVLEDEVLRPADEGADPQDLAVLVRHGPEELQHARGEEVLHGHLERVGHLRVGVERPLEGLQEVLGLALVLPALVPLVHDLQRGRPVDLLHGPVGPVAVGALLGLLAPVEGPLEEGGLAEHVRAGAAHLLQLLLAFVVGQQDARARLADALEQVQRVLWVGVSADTRGSWKRGGKGMERKGRGGAGRRQMLSP